MPAEKREFKGISNLEDFKYTKTYKRRKCMEVGESSAMVGSSSAPRELFRRVFPKFGRRDIGWEHGEKVDGHCHHWKCKYCGMVGQSGGVSRLKKHLAGRWNRKYHVAVCRDVPIDVARSMDDHIRETMKKNTLKRQWKMHYDLEKSIDKDHGRLDMNMQMKTEIEETRRTEAQDDIDSINADFPDLDDSTALGHGRIDLEMQVSNSPGQYKEAAHQFMTDREKPRVYYRQSWVSAQQSNIDTAKATNEPGDTILCTSTNEQDGNANIDSQQDGNANIDGQQDGNANIDGQQDGNANIDGQQDGNANIDGQQDGNANIDRQQDGNSNIDSQQDGNANMNSQQYGNANMNCQQDDNANMNSQQGGNANKNNRQDGNANMNSQHDGNVDTTSEQDGNANMNSHWRNVLESMLHLPYVWEGGGVRSCIYKALTSGPLDFKMVDAPKETTDPKDRCKGHYDVLGQSLGSDKTAHASLGLLKTGTYCHTNTDTRTCEDVLCDILCSDKFVMLCNLLCRSFKDVRVEKLFDFSLINSKMKNGDYERSPGLFDQDIQQVWKKFQEIGQEMVLLARSLSNISQASCEAKVGEDLVNEVREQICEVGEDLVNEVHEQICEVNYQVGVERKNSNGSYTTTQFPSCESDRSTKPDQTEASCLYKVCNCKHCGTQADGECSLICDGCEAVYHFSCAEPAVNKIPTRSWYCASCVKERRQSPEQSNTQEDSLHDNCVVCERLELTVAKEHLKESGRTPITKGSRESSVSSMESDEPPEPSRTALSRLCKQCGTCEDEDRRFLVCGHSQCPFKFYHIRCLKSSQIASYQQQTQQCWYCPSCLCRACFLDRDDDKIVLCDGCDEAYHTYCMKPPRTCVPKGQWYCLQCNIAKAREGMRRYEQWILQQHGKKDVRQDNDATRPMDVLLSAVEKISSEERLAARLIEK